MCGRNSLFNVRTAQAVGQVAMIAALAPVSAMPGVLDTVVGASEASE